MSFTFSSNTKDPGSSMIFFGGGGGGNFFLKEFVKFSKIKKGKFNVV